MMNYLVLNSALAKFLKLEANVLQLTEGGFLANLVCAAFC